MSNELKTCIPLHGPRCDLTEPHWVRRRDLRIVDELGGTRLEQKPHRQFLTRQTVINETAECVGGVIPAVKFPVCEIDTGADAQLFSARHLECCSVKSQRLPIAPVVVFQD